MPQRVPFKKSINLISFFPHHGHEKIIAVFIAPGFQCIEPGILSAVMFIGGGRAFPCHCGRR
jgi:hypothetical protein